MDKTSQKLIKTFGTKAEIIKAISEFSELSAALSEYLYCMETDNEVAATATLDEVFEEMGDARLTLNTLAHIFGLSDFQKALRESVEKANSHIRLREAEALAMERPSRYAKGKVRGSY